MSSVVIPPALAKISQGRDHIITEEFAKYIGVTCHTVLTRKSSDGHCYGVRPIKLGHRLLWPVAEVAKLLNGGAQ